ncbi:glutelin type-B 5-like [Panicum miliaceum]|uniref:Glutelin type-B 5-like n=1 Tax=Panicum miliaceum TaxID=4540 RepID=A0A3L6R7K1_PANMI|nr:glutelin type-B 5-like [Panicum miliaceum]
MESSAANPRGRPPSGRGPAKSDEPRQHYAEHHVRARERERSENALLRETESQQRRQGNDRDYQQADGRGHSPDDQDQMCRMKVTMNLQARPWHQRRPALPAEDEGHEPDRPQLPILNSLQVSVERGTLSQDVAVPPLYYTAGAQSVVYAVRGSARLQLVDNIGAAVFDGELRRGQLLVVPEFFVVLTEAGKDGVEYIAFRNDASPVTSRIAGPGSVLRGLPVGVIAASYNVPAKDAMKLKDSGGGGGGGGTSESEL